MSPGVSSDAPPSARFEIRMDVRWGDQDSLAHVNNAVYFRYLEEARIQLVNGMGLTADGDRVVVLAHASCDFLKPLLYPARIAVRMALSRIGRSSVDLDCRIVRLADEEILHARGRNVMVCTDARTGRSSAWTQSERTFLEQRFTA